MRWKPEFADAHDNLGMVLNALGKTTEAAEQRDLLATRLKAQQSAGRP